MRNLVKATLLSIVLALVAAGTASAANPVPTVDVTGDITVDTVWNANEVYALTKQIYVKDGASLTIPAGTIVATRPAEQGSLAVCRGSQIFIMGTKWKPVIMTSTNDDMTTWRAACQEWGNLTIMGDALISASHTGNPGGNPPTPRVVRDVYGTPNTATPTGLNQCPMEGLVATGVGDYNVIYGGDNDDDDSGEIHYLSLRYGGKVVSLTNELNGLSMGGIGRETDVDHVEIMNNVDDGIETWGGTVNYKYFSIWNIGDDSFDVDQGWRGKAQFGLIVQGYSTDQKQGSGIGDNCFETDGAEASFAQPVTTSTIYNCTVVGQPIKGDHGTAWRDNARVQYRNCIFMDLGEVLVKFDNDDGDGAEGYGDSGTLSWADTWTTDYSVTSAVNAGGVGTVGDPAVLYTVQTSGKLAEITDSVFFRNLNGSAYTEATARGVMDTAKNNVLAAYNVANPDDNMPIQGLTRGPLLSLSNGSILPVVSLNPCAANAAATSAAVAPDDGFFTPANYRGAFSATYNWLEGWAASAAYGLADVSMNEQPATQQVTMTTYWQSTAGVSYDIVESSDMVTWSVIATVVGDGTLMSITDVAPIDSSKFYKVVLTD